jgi:hypothetical protein
MCALRDTSGLKNARIIICLNCLSDQLWFTARRVERKKDSIKEQRA